MVKKKILIFLIIGIVFFIALVNSYVAPSYDSINMTLGNDYTAPSYNSINLTFGEIVADIDYSVALPLELIRFLDCGPDITNPHSQPDGQTSTIAAINATNNGSSTGDFTINLTGTLNTGWVIRASNDTFASNITLSTTAQTIWSSVAEDETKKIWLAATCNNVAANPGQSIDMQVS